MTLRRTLLLLGFLLVADAGFIGYHLRGLVTGVETPRTWKLDHDGGRPEMFQYLKEVAIAAILLIEARRRRSAVLGAWGTLFLGLFLDDRFRIHEHVGGLGLGGWLLRTLPGIGAPGYEIGQFLFYIGGGLAFLLLLGIAHRRAPLADRQRSRTLGAFLGVGASYAVVFDLASAHVPLPDRPLMIAIEESGEHLVMSAILAYVAHVAHVAPVAGSVEVDGEGVRA